MEVGFRVVGPDLPLSGPRVRSERAEILKPWATSCSLEYRFGSENGRVGFNDSDNTKQAQGTFRSKSKYWVILPESAQS